MSPILGIIASSQQPQFLGSFESIATVTVGAGGSSSISFSSIPSTYKHLQIRYLAQTSRATYDGNYLKVNFNSDTGSNYYYGHQLEGDGANAISWANGAGTAAFIERITNNQMGSSIFAGGITDILDYADTNKYKTLRSLIGFDLNGAPNSYSGRIDLASALWRSTSAINSITIAPGVSSNFTQYSHFALYGVKG